MKQRRLWIGWRITAWIVLFNMTAWAVKAETLLATVAAEAATQAATPANPAQPLEINTETGHPQVAILDAILMRGTELNAVGRFYVPGAVDHGLGIGWRLSCDEQVMTQPDGNAKVSSRARIESHFHLARGTRV